ncbi:MAG: immune inhibitor A [Ignavibacteria bacterium]|nr:immune inhibitor A [Ignavibacteria bacterium]
MRLRVLFFLCVILLQSLVLRAEDYKKIRVTLTDRQADIQKLVQAGFALEGSVLRKDNTLDFYLSETEFKTFMQMGLQYEVQIDSWDKHFNLLPKMSDAEKQESLRQLKEKYGIEGFNYGSFAGYYSLDEINKNLDTMRLKYPNLVSTKFSIGNSIENRPIYGVKICSNNDVSDTRPEVLFMGMHHAREPEGMMTIMCYMYYLLENYQTNPLVKYILDNRQIYFIPIVNVDGYEYNRSTNPSGGGMWRKNRRNNSGSYGVDINRNYGPMIYWDAPNGGSSTVASDDTYRGTAPFSEPEVAAVRDFLKLHRFKACLDYHTYSNLCIYPYGALNHETADSLIFREYAADIVAYNGYTPGTDLQTVGYSTRGGSLDYLYDGDLPGTGKVFAMTLEVGSDADGFWPAQNRIFPLAQANILPNLYYSLVAGPYVALKTYSSDRQYVNPGETVKFTFTMKNKGLSAAQNLHMQLESLSPSLTVQTASVNVDSISSRSVYTIASPFTVNVASNAPIQQKHRLVLKTYTGSSLMASDTIAMALGTPVYVLRDSCNTISTNWVVTASPSTPAWETTTSTFTSAPTCFTDSKSGNYANSATVTLATKNQLNLTNLANPHLSFKTKYDIEKSYDCGLVMVSTDNGSSWKAMAGMYTTPGVAQGVQTAGTPLYDGTRSDWVSEDIDLSEFTNKQIKIKFELRTDSYLTKDGWYIDDIGVYTYAANSAITWLDSVIVKDAGSSLQKLTYGLAPGASNGIDAGLGEASLTAIPSAGIFDVRFALPTTPVDYSIRDMRNDSLTACTWRVIFQPSASGYPMTISWNPSTLPVGTFELKDEVSGSLVNVNMKQSGTATITDNSVKSVKIVYSRQNCSNITANSGWNLVSVPYQLSSMLASAVYPTATSQVYGYNAGYFTASQLVNGAGYWARFGSSIQNQYCGTIANSSQISLQAGWNLIGIFEKNVSTTGIISNPAGILNSQFFGYNNGYQYETTLTPGKGYWIRTSQAGTITLPATVSEKNVAQSEIVKGMNKISVSDANGNMTNLYLRGENTSLGSNFVMPPLPPMGIFDARFSDNTFAAFAGERKTIQIQSAIYPVTLQTSDGRYTIQDALTHGKLFSSLLDPSSKVSIPDNRVDKIEIISDQKPLVFSLGQNYPNPFNPTTKIAFTIAEKCSGRLIVFNQLGQIIKIITSGEFLPGSYQYEFNASGLATGVYFYELQAGNFRSAKKLLVIK